MRRVSIATDGVTVANVVLATEAGDGFLVDDGIRVGPGWTWNGDTGFPAFTPVARDLPVPFGGKGEKGDPGDGGNAKAALAFGTGFGSDPTELIGQVMMLPLRMGPAEGILSQSITTTIELEDEPSIQLLAFPEPNGLRIFFSQEPLS